MITARSPTPSQTFWERKKQKHRGRKWLLPSRWNKSFVKNYHPVLDHLFIVDFSSQRTHHQAGRWKRPHTRSRACEMPSLILSCFKEPFTGVIKSRFLKNDRTHRLSWKEACFGSHLRTSVKTVQGMCSERKMRFLGHPAFAAQHMLLHNGKHPLPSLRGSEYFMSLLNGEIIDEGTPGKSAIGFRILSFSR